MLIVPVLNGNFLPPPNPSKKKNSGLFGFRQAARQVIKKAELFTHKHVFLNREYSGSKERHL
jgi:hypothetical protein